MTREAPCVSVRPTVSLVRRLPPQIEHVAALLLEKRTLGPEEIGAVLPARSIEDNPPR